MDVLKQSAENLRRMWGNLKGPQRVLVGAAAATLTLLLVWGSSAASKPPTVRVVGPEVSDAERSEVLRKLAGRPYEVRGKEIHVPKEDADRVILELAGEGVLSDQAVWKFLESSDIFAPKWQIEKRYQVALQRRLEGMIRRIDSVRNASVQVSPASELAQAGFQQGAKAAAAVLLELHPNRDLSRDNVRAIAGLVSHAVPGLDRDRVTITDTRGRAYSVPKGGGVADTGGDLRDVEARLEDSIRSKITDLFPTARVVVRAIARGKDERLKEKKFGRGAVKAEEEQSTIKGATGAAPGGIKGSGEATPPAAERAPEPERQKSIKVEYLVDQTERELIDPAGQIESVTVGVLIPVEQDNALLTEERARGMIAMAVGKQADANGISVMLVPTRRPEPVAPPSLGERAAEWMAARWASLILLLLVPVALVFLYKIVKAAVPRAPLDELRALTATLAAGGGGESPVAEGETGRVQQGIREAIGRNPAGVAATLKQWLTGH